MSRRSKTLVVLGILVLLTTSGCVTRSFETRTLDQILSAGFDAKAKRICTETGSTTFPLQGSPRTVAAVNSTAGEARTLVNSGTEKLFDGQAVEDKTYVALCFIQVPKSAAPPNGRVLWADLPGDGGSEIVGLW